MAFAIRPFHSSDLYALYGSGIRFYERAGFTPIVEAPDWSGFGCVVGTS